MTSYQRSADMILGVPHNWIQSWALLLWFAYHSKLKVGHLRWLFGDAHIYCHETHVTTANDIISVSYTHLDVYKRQGYSKCADSLNVPILGGTSKEIQKSRSITTKSLRDGLDEVENAAINFAQVLAKKKIKTENINGNRLCAIACFKSAEKVASVL